MLGFPQVGKLSVLNLSLAYLKLSVLVGGRRQRHGPGVIGVMEKMKKATRVKLNLFPPYALVNVVVGMSRMKWKDKDLLEDLRKWTMNKLGNFTTTELLISLSAFAHLGYSHPAMYQKYAAVLVNPKLHHLDGLTIPQLTQLLQAYLQGGQYDDRLMMAVAACARKILTKASKAILADESKRLHGDKGIRVAGQDSGGTELRGSREAGTGAGKRSVARARQPGGYNISTNQTQPASLRPILTPSKSIASGVPKPHVTLVSDKGSWVTSKDPTETWTDLCRDSAVLLLALALHRYHDQRLCTAAEWFYVRIMNITSHTSLSTTIAVDAAPSPSRSSGSRQNVSGSQVLTNRPSRSLDPLAESLILALGALAVLQHSCHDLVHSIASQLGVQKVPQHNDMDSSGIPCALIGDKADRKTKGKLKASVAPPAVFNGPRPGQGDELMSSSWAARRTDGKMMVGVSRKESNEDEGYPPGDGRLLQVVDVKQGQAVHVNGLSEQLSFAVMDFSLLCTLSWSTLVLAPDLAAELVPLVANRALHDSEGQLEGDLVPQGRIRLCQVLQRHLIKRQDPGGPGDYGQMRWLMEDNTGTSGALKDALEGTLSAASGGSTMATVQQGSPGGTPAVPSVPSWCWVLIQQVEGTRNQQVAVMVDEVYDVLVGILNHWQQQGKKVRAVKRLGGARVAEHGEGVAAGEMVKDKDKSHGLLVGGVQGSMPRRYTLTAGVVSPESGLTVDLALVLPGARLAIDMQGPESQIRGAPGRLLGTTAVRQKLLEDLGWCVIGVDWLQWQGMTASSDKVAHLRGLLKAKGVLL